MCLKSSVFLLVIMIACNSHKSDFDKIFAFIESKYSHEFIEKFKNTPEEEVAKEYYSPLSSDFGRFFEEMKDRKMRFPQGNKMAHGQKTYVILNAWHRHLNHRPERIEEMIQEILKKNTRIDSCYQARKHNALETFQYIKIRDTIAIIVPVEIRGNGVKTSVLYSCPTNEWKDFNSNKDLVLTGMVTKMFSNEKHDQYDLYLQITALSDNDILYFYHDLSINDTIRIDLLEYGRLIRNIK